MEKKIVRLALFSTALTLGMIMYNSSFNTSKATEPTLDNGRPLKSSGKTYCCENSGSDCGAARCAS
jgi:hypothetical protein